MNDFRDVFLTSSALTIDKHRDICRSYHHRDVYGPVEHRIVTDDFKSLFDTAQIHIS